MNETTPEQQAQTEIETLRNEVKELNERISDYAKGCVRATVEQLAFEATIDGLRAELRRQSQELQRAREAYEILRGDSLRCRKLLLTESVEIVATECHKQWAGWTEYMMAKLSEDWDAWAPRWRRQIATEYADLSEQEKESDRVEARKILAALTKPAPEKP
jgi:HAMP domain-containing protein